MTDEINNMADHMRKLRTFSPVLRHMAVNQVMTPLCDANGALTIRIDGSRLEPAVRQVLAKKIPRGNGSLAAGVDLYINTELVRQGLKVFRPTLDECFALEEIELRIPIQDYVQPFPLFVIEFPAAYGWQRQATGQNCRHGLPVSFTYRPIAQVLCHLAHINKLCSSLVISRSELVMSTVIGKPSNATIEDDINEMLQTVQDITEQEGITEKRSIRVALNACLLLMENGFRRTDDYAGLRSQLAKKIQKGSKGKAARHLQANQEALHFLPEVFTFAQTIDVRGQVGSTDAIEVTPTGRHVKSHWRRAHWRLQRVGVGLAEVKRILIKHVLVNKDKLSHDAGDVLYK